MTTSQRILALVKYCLDRPKMHQQMCGALGEYSSQVVNIRARIVNSTARDLAMESADDKLYAALCEVVTPLNLGKMDDAPPPSSASAPTTPEGGEA